MPFTPFHFGPGLAAKAVGREYFSLSAFVVTQVCIDLEPLWHILRNEQPLHRFWHTGVGATVAACLCAVLVRTVSHYWSQAPRSDDHSTGKPRLAAPASWTAVSIGAVFGAYSHVLLDSVFHPDVAPLQPWSPDNPLFGIISRPGIEGLCILFGVAGLLGLALVRKGHRFE
jgi:hypothetical protein